MHFSANRNYKKLIIFFNKLHVQVQFLKIYNLISATVCFKKKKIRNIYQLFPKLAANDKIEKKENSMYAFFFFFFLLNSYKITDQETNFFEGLFLE